LSIEKRAGVVGRDQVDTALPQLGVADLLDHQVAREPAGGLDQDRPHAVASMRSSMAAKPGRASIGSAPLTAAS
jgi:hypothetical protein